jgi:flagellin-like hook-associated protein FlgL
MSNVVLPASIRNNLLSLQNTATQLATAQNDLATGLKVNSALDNPSAYFTSQTLNNSASALSSLLDGMGQNIQVLQATNQGLTSLTSLLNQALSVAQQAQAATPGTSEASYLLQYTTIQAQIGTLVADSGYNGTNLLNGGGTSMSVQFNATNTSKLSVASVTDTAAVLGLTAANSFGAGGNLVTTTIQAEITNINTALTTVQTQSTTFAENLSIIQTRQSFTSNMINVLTTGSDNLTVADKNQEGADLLALQTTQQLGIQALSLASQANQSVLRLFG